jgi:hypothetical protein
MPVASEAVLKRALSVLLHAPQGSIEATPLSDGPHLLPIEALVCGDHKPLWPLRLVDPYVNPGAP